MRAPYYPEIEERRESSLSSLKITLSTIVRKEYKGIWYDILIKDEMIIERDYTLVNVRREGQHIKFRYEVNKVEYLFNMDDSMLTLKNTHGDLIYPPSKEQRSEVERLKEFYKIPEKRTKSM